MPFSTNAPFNEFGYRQQNRDIEQLYLLLADLQAQMGATPAGDLNPGGGGEFAQETPDNMVGGSGQDQTPDTGGGTGGFAAEVSTASFSGTVAVDLITSIVVERDDFSGWTGAAYTIPTDGLYLITGALTVVVSLSGAIPYMSGSVQVQRNGIAFPGRSGQAIANTYNATTGNPVNVQPNVSFLVNLSAGDAITWFASVFAGLGAPVFAGRIGVALIKADA